MKNVFNKLNSTWKTSEGLCAPLCTYLYDNPQPHYQNQFQHLVIGRCNSNVLYFP